SVLSPVLSAITSPFSSISQSYLALGSLRGLLRRFGNLALRIEQRSEFLQRFALLVIVAVCVVVPCLGAAEPVGLKACQNLVGNAFRSQACLYCLPDRAGGEETGNLLCLDHGAGDGVNLFPD